MKAINKVKELGFRAKGSGVKLVLALMGFFMFVTAEAQKMGEVVPSNTKVDMATGMRSNGKIYVVVAVLCMVLTGLFLYLISLDRKISKLEKEHK